MTARKQPALCPLTHRAVADELWASATWFVQRSDQDWAGDVLINDDCVRAEVLRMKAAVSIGPRDGGGFGLAVKMTVEDRSLPQADLEAMAREAHETICPYSHATRNNVRVDFEVKGA
jgi:hypothetical protein